MSTSEPSTYSNLTGLAPLILVGSFSGPINKPVVLLFIYSVMHSMIFPEYCSQESQESQHSTTEDRKSVYYVP